MANPGNNNPIGDLLANSESRALEERVAKIGRDIRRAQHSVRSVAQYVARNALDKMPDHPEVENAVDDIGHLERAAQDASHRLEGLQIAKEELSTEFERFSADIQVRETQFREHKGQALTMPESEQRKIALQALEPAERQLNEMRTRRSQLREQLDKLEASIRENEDAVSGVKSGTDDILADLGLKLVGDRRAERDISEHLAKLHEAKEEVERLQSELRMAEAMVPNKQVVSTQKLLLFGGLIAGAAFVVTALIGVTIAIIADDDDDDNNGTAEVDAGEVDFEIEETGQGGDDYSDVEEEVHCGEGEPKYTGFKKAECTTIKEVQGEWKVATVISKTDKDALAGEVEEYRVLIAEIEPETDEEGNPIDPEAEPELAATITRLTPPRLTGSAKVDLDCDDLRVRTVLEDPDSEEDSVNIQWRFTHVPGTDYLEGIWNYEGRSWRKKPVAGGLQAARGDVPTPRIQGLRGFSCRTKCDVAKARVERGRGGNVRWITDNDLLECKNSCAASRRKAVNFNFRGKEPFEEGNFARAEELYRSSVNEDRSYAPGWYNLACAAAKRNKPKIVAEAINRFSLLRPDLDAQRRMAGEPSLKAMRKNAEFQTTLEQLRKVLVSDD